MCDDPGPSTSREGEDEGLQLLCSKLEKMEDKYRMNALNVKSVLRQLYDPKVFSVVLGQDSESVPSLKLTRSRAKAPLHSKNENAPVEVARTQRTFLNVEYNDDEEEDVEYDPEKDPTADEDCEPELESESDGDEDDLEKELVARLQTFGDELNAVDGGMEGTGGLGVLADDTQRLDSNSDHLRLDINDVLSEELAERVPWRYSTRSSAKANLNSTAAIDALEQEAQELYGAAEVYSYVDDEYLDFCQTLNAQPNMQEEESPDDPDFMPSEIDELDDEASELLKKKITEIPKRETIDLLTDLSNEEAVLYLKGLAVVPKDIVAKADRKRKSRSAQDASNEKERSTAEDKKRRISKFPSLEVTSPVCTPFPDQNVPIFIEEDSCSLLGSHCVTFRDVELRQLVVQLEQHVQLLTQSAVACHFDAELADVRNGFYAMINELDQLYYANRPTSYFDIATMPGAIRALHDVTMISKVEKWVPGMYGGPGDYICYPTNHKRTYPRPETCLLLQRCPAVKYPQLVPHCAMSTILSGPSFFTQSEDVLLALGLLQFGHIKINAATGGKYHFLCKHLLPGKTVSEVRRHMCKIRKNADSGGIHKIIIQAEKGELQLVMPFDEPVALNVSMVDWPEEYQPKWFHWFPTAFWESSPWQLVTVPPPRPPLPSKKALGKRKLAVSRATTACTPSKSTRPVDVVSSSISPLPVTVLDDPVPQVELEEEQPRVESSEVLIIIHDRERSEGCSFSITKENSERCTASVSQRIPFKRMSTRSSRRRISSLPTDSSSEAPLWVENGQERMPDRDTSTEASCFTTAPTTSAVCSFPGQQSGPLKAATCKKSKLDQLDEQPRTEGVVPEMSVEPVYISLETPTTELFLEGPDVTSTIVPTSDASTYTSPTTINEPFHIVSVRQPVPSDDIEQPGPHFVNLCDADRSGPHKDPTEFTAQIASPQEVLETDLLCHEQFPSVSPPLMFFPPQIVPADMNGGAQVCTSSSSPSNSTEMPFKGEGSLPPTPLPSADVPLQKTETDDTPPSDTFLVRSAILESSFTPLRDERVFEEATPETQRIRNIINQQVRATPTVRAGDVQVEENLSFKLRKQMLSAVADVQEMVVSPGHSRTDSLAVPFTPRPRTPSDRLSPCSLFDVSGNSTPERDFSTDLPRTPRQGSEVACHSALSVRLETNAARKRALFSEAVNEESRVEQAEVAYFPSNEELSKEKAAMPAHACSAPSSEVDLTNDEDEDSQRGTAKAAQPTCSTPEKVVGQKRRRTGPKEMKRRGEEAMLAARGDTMAREALARQIASDIEKRLSLHDELRTKMERIIGVNSTPTQEMWDELCCLLQSSHPDTLCLMSLLVPPSLVSADLLCSPLRKAYQDAVDILIAVEAYIHSTSTRMRPNARPVFKHLQEICDTITGEKDEELWQRLQSFFSNDILLWNHLRQYCHGLHPENTPATVDFEHVDLRASEYPNDSLEFECVDDLDAILGRPCVKKSGPLHVSDGHLQAAAATGHYVGVGVRCVRGDMDEKMDTTTNVCEVQEEDGTEKRNVVGEERSRNANEKIKDQIVNMSGDSKGWTSEQDSVILRHYNEVDGSNEEIALTAANGLGLPVESVKKRLEFLLALFRE